MTSGLSRDRSDILQLANGLYPTQLEQRWHAWRRMGLPGGAAGEAVSQSYGHPMPLANDGKAGDALDRRINGAEKAYAAALGEARRQLDLALAIQQGWLNIRRGPDGQLVDTTVHVATKEERAQASDLGVDCKRCCRPVACTPADRLLAGFCGSCFKWWTRNGRPDIVKVISEAEMVAQ